MIFGVSSGQATAYTSVHMGKDWRETFRTELKRLDNLADYVREVGRPYRTVQSWKLGDRSPPPEAARELASYLRSRSRALAAAADTLDAAAPPAEEE